jgi:hypothetical protein
VETALSISWLRKQGEQLARNAAQRIVYTPTSVGLAISGLLMSAIFFFAFGQRYSLAAYGSWPHQSIATLNHFSAEGAFLYVFGFVALFGLYAFVLRRGLHPANRLHWLLVGGFAVIFNVALLPMYPADAADIYDYILRGRMSTLYGLNPMHDAPFQVRSDRFYEFASQHDLPSTYGPAWEELARLASRVAGDDYIRAVIAFKLVSVVAYAVCALLIGLILAKIAPRRALAGVYLFAWNPLVIYMTAGCGHNDTVMMACMLFSVCCLTRHWYVAATLGAALGALVKFLPILLIPIVIVVAFRELQGKPRIRFAIVSLIGCVLLVGVFYSAYWTGPDMLLRITNRTRSFTGSAATLARQMLSPGIDGISSEDEETPKTDTLVQYTTLGLVGLFYVAQQIIIHRARDPMSPIRAITAILIFYLVVSATWFQPWYAIWVVSFAALLDNTPMRRLALYFSYFVTWQQFLYNYMMLRPEGWAPQPWRDLVPISVVIGSAWLYVGYFWISTWLRSATPSPLASAAGRRIGAARETMGVSESDLADELNMRTDDLMAYEHGTLSIPLNTAQRICQRLGLSLGELGL